MSDTSDQSRYYERMMDEIAVAHREQIDQLEAENAKLMESCKKWMGKAAHHEAVAIRLRKLLDYALPIAMYAASVEEGDRMRELMSVIGE